MPLPGFSGLVRGTLGAAGPVAVVGPVLSVGETLPQPTIPARVNDLGPNHLRCRQNAVELGLVRARRGDGRRSAGVFIGHALGDVNIGLLIL